MAFRRCAEITAKKKKQTDPKFFSGENPPAASSPRTRRCGLSSPHKLPRLLTTAHHHYHRIRSFIHNQTHSCFHQQANSSTARPNLASYPPPWPQLTFASPGLAWPRPLSRSSLVARRSSSTLVLPCQVHCPFARPVLQSFSNFYSTALLKLRTVAYLPAELVGSPGTRMFLASAQPTSCDSPALLLTPGAHAHQARRRRRSRG